MKIRQLFFSILVFFCFIAFLFLFFDNRPQPSMQGHINTLARTLALFGSEYGRLPNDWGELKRFVAGTTFMNVDDVAQLIDVASFESNLILSRNIDDINKEQIVIRAMTEIDKNGEFDFNEHFWMVY